MKQFFLTAAMLLTCGFASAQNADAIEQKMIEYGRMFNSKQNIYYYIGDDGKVTKVDMSCTIDDDMRADITEFFTSLPAFSGGAGHDMVSIVPAEGVQRSQGTVAQSLSGVEAPADSAEAAAKPKKNTRRDFNNRQRANMEAVFRQKPESREWEEGPKRVYEFDKVEKKPYLVGGKAEMAKYMEANRKYPDICREFGAQDRVLVGFIVERDGSISNVNVIKSSDPYLEQEAVRLVQNMPKWMPGSHEGRVVRVRFTMPIAFRR